MIFHLDCLAACSVAERCSGFWGSFLDLQIEEGAICTRFGEGRVLVFDVRRRAACQTRNPPSTRTHWAVGIERAELGAATETNRACADVQLRRPRAHAGRTLNCALAHDLQFDTLKLRTPPGAAWPTSDHLHVQAVRRIGHHQAGVRNLRSWHGHREALCQRLVEQRGFVGVPGIHRCRLARAPKFASPRALARCANISLVAALSDGPVLPILPYVGEEGGNM